MSKKALLLTSILSLGLCGTSAQGLLPRPQKMVHEKGFFYTKKSFIIQS